MLIAKWPMQQAGRQRHCVHLGNYYPDRKRAPGLGKSPRELQLAGPPSIDVQMQIEGVGAWVAR